MIEFYKEDKKELTEENILDFIYQITKGLEYLHSMDRRTGRPSSSSSSSNGTAHRFIKPEYISQLLQLGALLRLYIYLFTLSTIFLQDNRAKIGCIELTIPATQKNLETLGMVNYLSPELAELIITKKYENNTDDHRLADMW